jgi:uncharacterized repeat protein (TIGR03803 family)
LFEFSATRNIMTNKKLWFLRPHSWVLTLLVLILEIFLPGASAQTETVLYNFGGGFDGAYPGSGVIMDAGGNLYGTTRGGDTAKDYGTVFGMERSLQGVWSRKMLYRFTFEPDAEYPGGGVVFDGAGNLFGVTSGGGLGHGAVYKLTPTAKPPWVETVLYRFTGGVDGNEPRATLVIDNNGNLYGTTAGGGTNGAGTVFRLAEQPDGSWTETVLHSFAAGSDGQIPSGGVVFDSAGNLYGTTGAGGKYNSTCSIGCGTVFKLKPNGTKWTEKILHRFNGSDGFGPEAGIVVDTAGNLYGAAAGGGANGAGVVFELRPTPINTWTEKTIYTFTGGSDGRSPADLTLDAAGNLYGTSGPLLELSPDENGTWNFRILHQFVGSDGLAPDGKLAIDSFGDLFGAAAGGGNKFDGVIFEITQ